MTRYRKESDQKTIQVSLLLRKIWVIKDVYAYTLSVSYLLSPALFYFS